MAHRSLPLRGGKTRAWQMEQPVCFPWSVMDSRLVRAQGPCPIQPHHRHGMGLLEEPGQPDWWSLGSVGEGVIHALQDSLGAETLLMGSSDHKPHRSRSKDRQRGGLMGRAELCFWSGWSGFRCQMSCKASAGSHAAGLSWAACGRSLCGISIIIRTSRGREGSLS